MHGLPFSGGLFFIAREFSRNNFKCEQVNRKYERYFAK